MKQAVLTGLENFAGNPPDVLKGKRLGLLANPASVDRAFNHASTLINRIFPNQLKALFSPQHGFYAEKQDNMIESDHTENNEFGIPVFSLYSSTRTPTREMLDLIDVLIIDLQDAGTRVYTFIYTVSHCLEACAKYHKEVIILDRPNPIGGIEVEGNSVSKNCRSFVGRFPVPMRHGLTIGEISLLFNIFFNIRCSLKIVPMKGWKRAMYFTDTGLAWIAPSPNLPTPASAMVYPGQVIFEGTNISEGRGTTKPFELVGAPFLDTETIFSSVQNRTSGAILRPVCFQPTSGKWQGRVCRGFQIHIISPKKFKPYKTSIMLLQQIIKLHRNKFHWKEPPYEYEYTRLPIDLILGSIRLRKRITELEDIDAIEESWKTDTQKFKTISREFYLYD